MSPFTPLMFDTWKLRARSVCWQITHMRSTSTKRRVSLPAPENVRDRSELNLPTLHSVFFRWQLPAELNCQRLNVVRPDSQLHPPSFHFLLPVQVDSFPICCLRVDKSGAMCTSYGPAVVKRVFAWGSRAAPPYHTLHPLADEREGQQGNYAHHETSQAQARSMSRCLNGLKLAFLIITASSSSAESQETLSYTIYSFCHF